MSTQSMRRVAPWLLGLGLGIIAARASYRPLYYTRLMLTSFRQPLWRSPTDVGLSYTNVAFASSDGTLLQGWFIPRIDATDRPAPTVLFVHGWPWNRLGNRAGSTLMPDRTVDFLEPAAALHRAGFHVLLFDLRNHGTSAAAIPVTFGVNESRDVIGAIAMLRQRADVDSERIGIIGYSMGANALLYAVPQCQPIRAAIAVQPVHAITFARNFVRSELGAIGPLAIRLVGPLHQACGAPPLRNIDPAVPAQALGSTVVQYIQGSGDPWGAIADIRRIVAATPQTLPLIIAPSTERYGGYLYINKRLDAVVEFFGRYL
ncbi:MAG: alpha/beta fold hydrolase [Chloroflexales bacterium]|nr:alpha/beta fold hydrolase [Chloroflexales bacterium]